MKNGMRGFAGAVALWAGCASLAPAAGHSSNDAPDAKIALVPEPTESPRYLKDEKQATSGSIMVGGRAMAYQAEAGVLVVHLKDPTDDDPPLPKDERNGPPPPQPPEASMSYVAYFSRRQRRRASAPHVFCTTAAPALRRYGCTWVPLGPSGW